MIGLLYCEKSIYLFIFIIIFVIIIILYENVLIFFLIFNELHINLYYFILIQIKRRFEHSSLKQRARTAHAYEFKRDFGQVLASQMVNQITYLLLL